MVCGCVMIEHGIWEEAVGGRGKKCLMLEYSGLQRNIPCYTLYIFYNRNTHITLHSDSPAIIVLKGTRFKYIRNKNNTPQKTLETPQTMT